jgi:predicted metal-dependent hydrolase
MEMIWIFDGKPIKVDVILSDRKTSYIAVLPDMGIEFRGNASHSWDSIKTTLDKKAGQISKKLRFFEQFHPSPPEHKYENGETFHYLGRQYRLKKIAAPVSRIRLIGKWFLAELPDPDNHDRVRRMMDQWLREKAVIKLTERFDIHYSQLSHRIKEKPGLSFRKMKKRWGSCLNGRILLNTELVKTPLICIDYIVVHELCHVLYPKHNAAFYRRLSQIMPDWRQRKDRLERSII